MHDRTPRPVDTLLSAHTVLQTSRVAELHAYITGVEGEHARRVADTDGYRAELRRASLASIELALLHCTAPTRIDVERTNDRPYYVQFPLTNVLELESDGHVVTAEPGSGLVLSPGTTAHRRASAGWTLAFSVPRLLVHGRLSSSQAEPLQFEPRLADDAAPLRELAMLIVDAIDRGVAPTGGPLACALESAFVDMLLRLQPHSRSGREPSIDAPLRAQRVKAVTTLLESDLTRNLSVADMAATAGCSARALQATFVDLCGCTPLQFVQLHRLRRARALLEAIPGARTVAAAASATGFHHLGRFAAAYRRAFGETPSDTLRRRIEAIRPPTDD